MRILIAGYADADVAKAHSTLSGYGCLVTVTQSFTRLLEKMQELQTDVLVIPSTTDQFNAYKFLRLIDKPKSVKVILVTEKNHPSLTKYSITQGAYTTVAVDQMEIQLCEVIRGMDYAFPQDDAQPAERQPAPVGINISEKQIDKLVTELSEFIGPIASVLVQRSLDGAMDVAALYETLSLQIDDEDDRTRFLASVSS